MQIIFRPDKEFLLRPELEDFFRQKMEKLERFLQNIEPVKMELKVSLSSDRLRKGSSFSASAQLFLPRKNLRAKGEGRTIRAAMIEVREEMEEQIKKYMTQPEAKKRSEKKKQEGEG
ncbi:MAG: HPF/RaiA family ribosome-associated protein [Candidatus Paceibacterota bacterium]|jgi:ribosomal subunit interface protein